MKRPIIGFHQDEFEQWVAELSCNHTQHVRHQPPFQMRPWSTTEEGRRRQLGTELECRKCDDEPDYLRANRALVRRYYDELWNQWKLELIPELLADDFRFRRAVGRSARGRSAFTDHMKMMRAASPDFHNHVQTMMAEDNRVVARVQHPATNSRGNSSLNPGANHISYVDVTIFAVGGHQLMSAWVFGDCFIAPRLDAALL